MISITIEFKPLSDPLFRSPNSVFDAGIHGPAVVASSLSYPMPSTISGTLSHIAYVKGLCSDEDLPDDIHELRGFKDHRVCLERLLGEGFILRPGLVEYDNTLYAYTGTSRLPRLEDVLKGGTHMGQPLELGRSTFIGIALDRQTKTPKTGMLYHAMHAGYATRGATILVLAEASRNIEEETITIHFGGENRTAVINIKQGGRTYKNLILEDDNTDKSPTWNAILLTPALIDYEAHHAPSIEHMVIADETLARTIAHSLRMQSHPEVRSCIRELRITEIPRNEFQLEIVNPGWSMKARAPREPYLLIPPGTRLEIEASKECIMKTVKHGIGTHSHLGWGTLVTWPTNSKNRVNL